MEHTTDRVSGSSYFFKDAPSDVFIVPISFEGGTPTDHNEILQKALSEKPFFGRRGGITFSGGEPTAQAEALVPLFRSLKDNGIHICIDSNGGIWNSNVETLLSLADLVLLDIKEFNPGRHKALTGCDNSRTLRTAAWLEEHNKPFWLRYVLVPGYSDFEEDIRALCAHFKDYRMIQKLEILPYHTLGSHKYESLGKEYALKDVPLNTQEQLERAKSIFEEYFDCVSLN